jgi:hypothetical protein
MDEKPTFLEVGGGKPLAQPEIVQAPVEKSSNDGRDANTKTSDRV